VNHRTLRFADRPQGFVGHENISVITFANPINKKQIGMIPLIKSASSPRKSGNWLSYLGHSHHVGADINTGMMSLMYGQN
jgi:hypothetical protein